MKFRKLRIERNFDSKKSICRYKIFDDDEVPRKIFAYTNDTEIFDSNLECPSPYDYDNNEEYAAAIFKYQSIYRKARRLYEEAVKRAEED